MYLYSKTHDVITQVTSAKKIDLNAEIYKDEEAIEFKGPDYFVRVAGEKEPILDCLEYLMDCPADDKIDLDEICRQFRLNIFKVKFQERNR